jgi:hypothetical protein
MLLRFTKLTDERHRFEIVRDDGTREAHELETRSFLAHDLAHYAVETEGHLTSGFYGQLHAGRTIAQISDDPSQDPEALQVERVVAQIQGASKGKDWAQVDPAQFASRLAENFRATAEEPPGWLDADCISRVRERLRRVQGQWRATPFHQSMELKFP